MTDLKQCSYCGTWRHKSVKRCPTCGAGTTVSYWLACWGIGLALGLIVAGLLSGCTTQTGSYPHEHIEINGQVVEGLDYD
jgi:hypothetical protein